MIIAIGEEPHTRQQNTQTG